MSNVKSGCQKSTLKGVYINVKSQVSNESLKLVIGSFCIHNRVNVIPLCAVANIQIKRPQERKQYKDVQPIVGFVQNGGNACLANLDVISFPVNNGRPGVIEVRPQGIMEMLWFVTAAHHNTLTIRTTKVLSILRTARVSAALSRWVEFTGCDWNDGRWLLPIFMKGDMGLYGFVAAFHPYPLLIWAAEFLIVFSAPPEAFAACLRWGVRLVSNDMMEVVQPGVSLVHWCNWVMRKDFR